MSRPKGSRNKIQKIRICRCGQSAKEYYIKSYPTSKYSKICNNSLCNLSKFNSPFIKGHKFGVGKKYLLGRKFSEEHRRKISLSNLGKKLSEETRKKLSIAHSGEKSNFWKGGVTDINKRIKQGRDYKNWRKQVFERDNYTCQECSVRGGEIHPHHIKPFALFPNLRFELLNGLTLCASCHRKTDTYGGKIQRYAKVA